MSDIRIFTGSAGAGISIAATASALHSAALGRRTLLLGPGSAYGFGAPLGLAPGRAPQPLAPQLDVLLLDGAGELASMWQSYRDGIHAQMAAVASDELPIPPSAELFFGLLRLAELAPLYDDIVLDAGPQEPFLRMLAFPDGLRWAVRLLIGLDREPGRSTASLAQALAPTSFMPIDSLDRIQQLRADIERTRDQLIATSAARYILRPDRAALAEARMAVPAIQLHGLAVHGLLIGPLLPDSGDARLARLLEQQRALAAEAAAAWPGRALLPFDMPEGDDLAALQRTAQKLYAAPAGTSPAPRAPITTAHQGQPALAIDLAGMPTGALRITLSGDELIVQLGPYRRHILLPAELRGASIKATREGDMLLVRRR